MSLLVMRYGFLRTPVSVMGVLMYCRKIAYRHVTTSSNRRRELDSGSSAG
jgi:hypothetical protein